MRPAAVGGAGKQRQPRSREQGEAGHLSWTAVVELMEAVLEERERERERREKRAGGQAERLVASRLSSYCIQLCISQASKLQSLRQSVSAAQCEQCVGCCHAEEQQRVDAGGEVHDSQQLSAQDEREGQREDGSVGSADTDAQLAGGGSRLPLTS